jgi:hypothetical protein
MLGGLFDVETMRHWGKEDLAEEIVHGIFRHRSTPNPILTGIMDTFRRDRLGRDDLGWFVGNNLLNGMPPVRPLGLYEEGSMLEEVLSPLTKEVMTQILDVFKEASLMDGTCSGEAHYQRLDANSTKLRKI